VPGLGSRTVDRLLDARRFGTIREIHLVRLRVPLKRALPFLILPERQRRVLEREDLRRLVVPPGQLDLFAA
jgi:predicted DNA-binding helix-hairpin-helix protein